MIDCVYILTVIANNKREMNTLKKKEMKILELENAMSEEKKWVEWQIGCRRRKH